MKILALIFCAAFSLKIENQGEQNFHDALDQQKQRYFQKIEDWDSSDLFLTLQVCDAMAPIQILFLYFHE